MGDNQDRGWEKGEEKEEKGGKWVMMIVWKEQEERASDMFRVWWLSAG